MRRTRTMRGMTYRQVIYAVAAGLVAAVTLMTVLYGRQAERQRKAARVDIATLARALDMYQLTTGNWPGPDRGLEALVYDPGVQGWEGPYLKTRRLPTDPWGNPYRYELRRDLGRDFVLYSAGPDGVPGTKDDIGNFARGRGDA